MSSTAEQLAASTIERWIKQVEFITTATLDDLGDRTSGLTTYSPGELGEAADREQLAKRSKPSYQWKADEHERWVRVWVEESTLTIQIDLHYANGDRQMNLYEIDLEDCQTATAFLGWLYRSTLHKQWACPEMLWAIMEVADEASKRQFGKPLVDAYTKSEELKWN